MIKHHVLTLMAVFSLLTGCGPPAWWTIDDYQTQPQPWSDYPGDEGPDTPESIGGGLPFLTLPFRSGAYWQLTQGYGADNIWGTHQDWGFAYGDDSKALDFSREGCEPFGELVFPVAPGVVMLITEDGDGDHGYGNSVLIDHGGGYVSRYGHLELIAIHEGAEVDPSIRIGTVGNSGNVAGSVCREHPGTHLHLAFYKDGVAIPPLPLSGLPDLTLRCWYNREGEEYCGSNIPEEYEPVDADDDGWEDYEEGSMAGEEESEPDEEPTAPEPPDDPPEEEEEPDNPMDDPPTEDEPEETQDDEPEGAEDPEPPTTPPSDSEILGIHVSPSWGRANETKFVWSAVVDSPTEPDVNLLIYNPVDDHAYSFSMETQSLESPWVFTYRKDLQLSVDYDFWIETDDGAVSDVETIDLMPGSNHEPDFRYFLFSPTSATVDEEERFEVLFESSSEVTMNLVVVNGLHGVNYSFPMTVNENSTGHFYGHTWKGFQNPIVYPYWTVVENDRSITTSPVRHISVSE